jgi:hypothetical protein
MLAISIQQTTISSWNNGTWSSNIRKRQSNRKQPFPKNIQLGRWTFLREVHSKKQQFSIGVVEIGIITWVNDEHSAKLFDTIEMTELGIMIDFNFLHCTKQDLGMILRKSCMIIYSMSMFKTMIFSLSTLKSAFIRRNKRFL